MHCACSLCVVAVTSTLSAFVSDLVALSLLVRPPLADREEGESRGRRPAARARGCVREGRRQEKNDEEASVSRMVCTSGGAFCFARCPSPSPPTHLVAKRADKAPVDEYIYDAALEPALERWQLGGTLCCGLWFARRAVDLGFVVRFDRTFSTRIREFTGRAEIRPQVARRRCHASLFYLRAESPQASAFLGGPQARRVSHPGPAFWPLAL